MYVMLCIVLTMNFVPLSVAELELRRRLENGRDGSASVIDREGHSAVDHLEDQIVPTTLNGQQETGDVSRFDLHSDVEIEADSVFAEGVNEASFVEEISRLDLI